MTTITIGEMFKEIRKQAGFNQEDFKGIADRRTIGRFERGQQNLGTDRLTECLERMGLNIAEFTAQMDAKQSGLTFSVPEYSWEDLRLKRRTPSGFVMFDLGTHENAFALQIHDTSMIGRTRALPVGAHIIVEPSDSAKDDELVIVKKGEKHYCRRVSGELRVPDNAEFETIKGGRIIGRVIGVTWLSAL